MRLFPQSVFGRLVLVLTCGLLVAQAAGAIILLYDRGTALYEASGLYTAQRVASTVRVLDTLDTAQRALFLRAVNTPNLGVRLSERPKTLEENSGNRRASRLKKVLSRLIGDDRPVYVRVTQREVGAHRPPPPQPGEVMPGTGRFPGPGSGPGPGRWGESWRNSWDQQTAGDPWTGGPQRRWRELWRAGAGEVRFSVATPLTDGTWAIFVHEPPEEAFLVPGKLFIVLAVLLVSVMLISLLAVRWATRPLRLLGDAADELGRDIDRPPLSESGPLEVARAARAFNTMQTRIARYVKDREEMLAAISHDLKTPITRLRLRAEMIEDTTFREKMVADLDEMESMVNTSLEFMRDAARTEPVRQVDIQALVESVAADLEETGGQVTVLETSTAVTFPARPQSLKRCVVNLVENAVKYGGSASISVVEGERELCITVLDEGPGIDEELLLHVFEPFYRLEPSRSRETGGVGLGLSIARSIARAHGGELELKNRPEGGLSAAIILPRG